MNKVREHLKEHKEVYITGGFILAGFTLFVMGGRYAVARGASDGLETVTVRPLSFLSSGQRVLA